MAPFAASIPAGTPSWRCLAALQSVTNPQSKTSEEPAISVKTPHSSPPVQLSAVASFAPRARKASSRRRASSSKGAGNIQPPKRERYPPGNGYRQGEAEVERGTNKL